MVFNFSNSTDAATYNKSGLPEDVEYNADIINYINTMKDPGLRSGRHKILLLDVDYGQNMLVLNKNIVKYSGYDLNAGTSVSEILSGRITEAMSYGKTGASALIIKPPKRKRIGGRKMTLLLNADTHHARYSPRLSLVSELSQYEFPAISFTALTTVYGNRKKDIDVVYKRFYDNTLKLLDYTADEEIDFTTEELSELNKKRPKLTPPRLGFTALDISWHRPGFVLLHDTIDNKYLLAGQDEGSYFIVELPRRASTVDEAMQILIPEEARRAGTQRQGEWFFVPCEDSEVPKVNETLLIFTGPDAWLPLDTEWSNEHYINCEKGYVGTDHYVYLQDPEISHNDHAALRLKGWYYVVKNTAVRSFSITGVD